MRYDSRVYIVRMSFSSLSKKHGHETHGRARLKNVPVSVIQKTRKREGIAKVMVMWTTTTTTTTTTTPRQSNGNVESHAPKTT